MYQAVERILAGHMPYPAVVIDLSWDLVAANDAAYALFVGTPPWLLEPPVNVVRLCLHPQGLSDRIDNLDQWRAALLHRLRRELELTGDARLADLLAEVEQYDPPRTAQQGQVGQVGQVGEELVVPLHLRTDRGLLSLFGTTTVFGTPRDIAVSELAIEAFYPADDHTRAVLNQP